MAQKNVDLGILKDTKIIDGVYTHQYAGFHIVASDTLIHHCVGVALFYK